MVEEGIRIEEESMQIIEGLIEGIEPRYALIVKRVVHATADPMVAEMLVFQNNCIEEGENALRRGSDIVTDVNMVRAGINEDILGSFGGRLYCFIKNRGVQRAASDWGITRAAASMRLNKEMLPGSIVAIGNAPTALFELIRLYREEGVRPALVVGTPVGFVGASESKEELLETDLPCIVLKGKRGGSPVAAAVVNAFLRMVEPS